MSKFLSHHFLNLNFSNYTPNLYSFCSHCKILFVHLLFYNSRKTKHLFVNLGFFMYYLHVKLTNLVDMTLNLSLMRFLLTTLQKKTLIVLA